MPRSGILLVLMAAIAVLAWLWQGPDAQTDSQDVTSARSRSAPNPGIAPTQTATGDHMSPPASTSAEAQPTFPAPAAPDPLGIRNSAAPARAQQSASIRLDIHAPASAHIGDRITVAIDAEAFRALSDLAFTVIYDGTMLELVSSAPGSFVQQASAPATLSAEDTSTGNVLVHLQIRNGGIVIGKGNVVALELKALNAGTSLITLHDISLLESAPSTGSPPSDQPSTSITIEER